MYGCESWTIKKAEHWRIDASELWCWRRLLRVPWTSRRSNQSILKEIILCIHGRTNVEAEAPINILASLCEELTHLKRAWCWERLRAREVDNRRWNGWMASLTQWTWVWASSRSWWWTGKRGMLQSKGFPRVGCKWVSELNRTGLNWMVQDSATRSVICGLVLAC